MIAPSSASRQNAWSDTEAPSGLGTAAVINRRFSDKTGDDQPLPGRATFHATLLEELQVMGTFVAKEIPCPVGPRNSGHESAAACSCLAAKASKQAAKTPSLGDLAKYKNDPSHGK